MQLPKTKPLPAPPNNIAVSGGVQRHKDNFHSVLASEPRSFVVVPERKAAASGCEQWLDGTTQRELEELATYARFRLRRAGLPPNSAEDVRQNAFLAVLLGRRSDLRGRHPRPADLADRNAFTNYLKGIICSLVEAKCRHRERGFTFVDWDPELTASPDPEISEQVASEDLARQLFIRLHQRVPAHLLPTLGHWAVHWRDSKVIPLAGNHRRHRQELRALAAKVLDEVSLVGRQWSRRIKLEAQSNYE